MVYPYPLGAGSARPNPKMGAPDPENPLFLGFSVTQRGIETMVSEGARPWVRGRSGDCPQPRLKSQLQGAIKLGPSARVGWSLLIFDSGSPPMAKESQRNSIVRCFDMLKIQSIRGDTIRSRIFVINYFDDNKVSRLENDDDDDDDDDEMI